MNCNAHPYVNSFAHEYANMHGIVERRLALIEFERQGKDIKDWPNRRELSLAPYHILLVH